MNILTQDGISFPVSQNLVTFAPPTINGDALDATAKLALATSHGEVANV